MNARHFAALVLAIGLSALLAAPVSVQQQVVGTGDWPLYRHDAAGTGYSTLSEITPSNVARLTTAWTYSLQSAQPAPAGRGGAAGGANSEATPIVVNGVMYLP